MSRKIKTTIWLSDKERLRLDLIREIHGVSLSGAIRAAIRAVSRELGLESDDNKYLTKT